MYRYNMVIPMRIFLLVRDVANAKNMTLIAVITMWIKEGHARWLEEKEKQERWERLHTKNRQSS